MSEQTGVKLIISELEKSFGELKVLRKIDIQIAPGEFVAIVGKSGCGKSTLLRHIAGLEEQNAGQIKQDNAQVVDLNEEARIMFQEARLLPRSEERRVGKECRARGWACAGRGRSEQRRCEASWIE